MKYDWIFFDADGTLFDYEFAEVTALKDTFEHHGIGLSESLLKTYKEVNGNVWKLFEQGKIDTRKLRVKRFADLKERLSLDFDPQKFSEQYLLSLSKNTKLLDGSEELLQKLHGKVKMLLVTNGLKEVQRPRFNASSIIKYFEGMVISDEIGVAKPQKEYFDYAFNAAGNPPKDKVLMVGDSLSSDIKGGNDYGIDTCLITFHESESEIEPTFSIASLEEIITIIE